ncbi:MAG: 3-hydroxybutyryl-CoA dehydrogenase [Candidatus Azobacteroides pseudotrichonymphae]|jgi:3-hydroxybutyryl-CoA dehydrogenase|uniref:3-hydroxybutyryl-CoA dehydrogenase n=1 Tax=Azobacteroides pseudotrichonymphae genomovar. CFP2 TaxID=511995 RepID=B6YQ98_AZOPC|nr:3-hydroxyacyl-CoA dehydrogenase family protein [Candidatus Azobacteroides pseudotrichonymphae]MDR0530165.1 3-hydroxyacyl-CoA dehydrogenase family protein [Bacteroidales bacterium OttesenSCG-928-I14]BAG83370.1 3-hydroxybutyryl-CoA dehydrogenase [Candidatus Azobacteroides pseudotrichonymphae genomovar. CFP2]GMO36734.1 MAG: 3-hydroxybutyryl-CoA dehydrogenase [Candidatus Azobacteroides pseudotrichonymphae]
MSKIIVEPIEPFGLSLKEKRKSLFSKIGVVGAGRDGRNIIRLTSSAGLEVIFVEVCQERIDFAFERISEGLDNKIENWGLTSIEKRAILGRIKGSTNYNDLRDCDFVIECIRYNTETGERSTKLRKEAFKEIERVVSPEAIIATNAITVIISELASELIHKGRCVSLHFPIAHTDARILEVVKGIYTSEEVYNKILLFAKLIQYETIEVSESNGLVSLRLMVVMLNEACQMVLENVSSMVNIDRLTEIVYGMRIGLFKTADAIGIEKIVPLMESMFNEYGDKKYKPSPLLWRMYRTQQLGIRNGKGFYIYENGKIIKPNIE